jgi:hypothetical protein
MSPLFWAAQVAENSTLKCWNGLRGSAAFLIVIFHVFICSCGFHGPWALVKHAYLAVDFFFALTLWHARFCCQSASWSSSDEEPAGKVIAAGA